MHKTSAQWLVGCLVAGVVLAGASPSWAAERPDAPAPASVVAGSLSATVSWTIPADNGSPLTGFLIVVGLPGQYYASASRSVGPTETTTTVSGLLAGQPYWVGIRAFNAVGRSPLASAGTVTPLGGVPSAPTITAAAAGTASATVTWTAPYDGGSPITGYVVTPYLGDTAQPAQTFSSTATSQPVVGLTNGEEYRFRVAAINANGTGPESTLSVPVRVGAPLAPRSPSAEPGNGSATVSWLPPLSDNGSPITGYVVTPYRNGAPQGAQTFMSTALSQTASGLTNGVGYTFGVAAINANGAGVSSSQTASIRTGTPGAPAPASAVAGSLSATVSWTIPPDNGSPISGFTVRVGLPGSYWPSAARTVGPTETTATVDNLVPGKTYWVAVLATNAVGGSPLASAGHITVSTGLPSAPTALNATGGAGSAVVSWTAPFDGGEPITGYVVTPYAGEVARPAQTFTSNATSQTVSGLTDGETLTFRVAAMNVNGTGAESAASNPVAIGAPSAPRSPVAGPGNGSATVSWLAPLSDHGSPITGYLVTPIREGVPQPSQTFMSSATSQTIAGLTNGARYTFTVAAINDNGTGPPSNASTAIKIGTPGAPAPASVVAGSRAATVSWTIPPDNGSAIQWFTVFMGVSGDPNPTVGRTVASTATTVTVTGLVAGQKYWVQVTAVNGRGQGPLAYAGSVIPSA